MKANRKKSIMAAMYYIAKNNKEYSLGNVIRTESGYIRTLISKNEIIFLLEGCPEHKSKPIAKLIEDFTND